MLVLIFALTMLYGVFFKRNKYFWLWCAILLAVMFNTTLVYADFPNYEYIFNNINKGDFSAIFNETGPTLWYILCFIFGKIGLAYRGMVVVVIFISTYLINYRVRDIKVNDNIFWALFILFPGIIQCVQLRFFLGTSIVAFGLIPLLQNKKNSYLTFLICLVISYFFHSSCLIFSMFLLFPLFNKIGYRKTLILSFFVTIILYIGFQQIIPLIVKGFVSSAKFERYFDSSTTETTILRFIIILFDWFLCFIANSFILNRINKSTEIDSDLQLFSNNIQKTISLLLITIFFLTFDANFHRFLQMGYILLFLNISIFFNYIKMNKENFVTLLFVTAFIVCFAYNTYTPYSVTTDVFTYDGFQPIFVDK